jgi:hypothetical protein
MEIDKAQESEAQPRHSNGRLKKGARLNPVGGDRRTAMMLRNLQDLTPRAIARLGKLVESESEQIALGAVKEVLDRNLGKAKQSVSVDVDVSLNKLHLEALQRLADMAQAKPDMIDVTPSAEPIIDAIAIGTAKEVP